MSDSKINFKKLSKVKENPIFAGLPSRLKEVEIYDKIEKELYDVVQTDHKHRSVKQYVTCAWCQKKRELKQNTIKAVGFTSLEQYLEWRKVMEVISKKQSIQIG